MSAIIRQERAAPPAHDEDFVLWAEAPETHPFGIEQILDDDFLR